MGAPFFPAIKGITAGTPGTGAFTPSAAATGYRAWTNAYTGWIGLVRYEDGAAWELSYGYWNATTITRTTNGFLASSTGSVLTLTSAATAALIMDGDEIQQDITSGKIAYWMPASASSTITAVGIAAPTSNGTLAAVTPASTNLLTCASRCTFASVTTANALAGPSLPPVAGTPINAVRHTVAGVGGFEFTSRFGASGTLPTSPRLQVGVSTATMTTVEPSTVLNSACFTKDSTDTNIQFTTKDGTTASKTDTGIPLVLNGWYEAFIFCPPGGAAIEGLLVRLDTGAVWFGSKSTNLPVAATGMGPVVLGGLSATTGTAFTLNFGGMNLKQSF